MNLKQANVFFASLGDELKTPLVIALTGGMAASLLADPRTTDDIDFAVLKAAKAQKDWEAVLQKLASRHGVVLQYSEDIDRWSSVSYLDWQKHSRPWKKFENLEVRILEPLYWSIEKIARATQRDILDLEAVLKAQKIPWQKLVTLWARSLRNSPASTSLFNARKQMEGFLKESGGKIWGKSFELEAALKKFHLALESH